METAIFSQNTLLRIKIPSLAGMLLPNLAYAVNLGAIGDLVSLALWLLVALCVLGVVYLTLLLWQTVAIFKNLMSSSPPAADRGWLIIGLFEILATLMLAVLGYGFNYPFRFESTLGLDSGM